MQSKGIQVGKGLCKPGAIEELLGLNLILPIQMEKISTWEYAAAIWMNCIDCYYSVNIYFSPT